MDRHILNARCFVLTLGLICAVSPAQGQDNADMFPYQAIVRSVEAAVYSGPSKVHYVTCNLAQGQTVEVYRHDPDGWVAIRPPKGSFSLLPASSIEELGNGIGEITEEGTQAWVGTQLGPVEKPLWQVKLRAGEQVRLLGIATWPDPEGFTTSWYQIDPPAGEFRWIRINELSIPASVHARENQKRQLRSSPVQREIQNAGYEADLNERSKIEVASYQSQDGWGTSSFPHDREVRPRSTSSSGWRQARTPIEKSPANRFESLPTADRSNFNSPPDRMALAGRDTRYDVGTAVNGGLSSGFQTRAVPAMGPLTPRLTELELKLSQEMIKEPNQWRLIDLQTAAEKVGSTSTDAVEQIQAQRFLAKLEGCRQLRDQFIRSSGQRSGQNPEVAMGESRGRSTESISTVGTEGGKDLSLNTLYDAHGWLKELVRDGGRTDPTYVLQDENGKVTHHVSPGPGMNLSVYVSRRIGIIGQRGYHTRLKLDHVTAHKIIELK
jgi:hypothetical protein